MANTWEQYRAALDARLGALQASNPAAFAAAQAYIAGAPGKSNPEHTEMFFKNAVAELQRAGYSEADAKALLQIGYNVRRHPGAEVNSAGMSGVAHWIDPSILSGFGQSPIVGDPDAAAKQSINDKINAFINEMKGAPSAGDPVMRQLQHSGQQAAGMASGRAGISARSGLAGVQAASVTQANVLPYLQQRQQLYSQGLGLLNQRDLGLGALEQGWQQLQNSQANAAWAAQQNQNQALGSALGTGLGAVVGGYFGNAKMGMEFGSQFGGGLGGMMSGGAGPNYAKPAGVSSGGAGRGNVNPYTGY